MDWFSCKRKKKGGFKTDYFVCVCVGGGSVVCVFVLLFCVCVCVFKVPLALHKIMWKISMLLIYWLTVVKKIEACFMTHIWEGKKASQMNVSYDGGHKTAPFWAFFFLV